MTPMHENLSTQLQLGIKQLGLSVGEAEQQKMLTFLQLLQKWNKAYNLTAIRALSQMVSHHVLDSLSVAPYIFGERILDVGTGAGFPGVPLALYSSSKQFVLLDSNGKKIRFLQQAKATLDIVNITPMQERMEKLLDQATFDVIICRAVGEMSSLMQASRPLLSKKGCWLFMKGVYPQAELDRISQPYQVHKLCVPGVDALRHVVIVEHR